MKYFSRDRRKFLQLMLLTTLSGLSCTNLPIKSQNKSNHNKNILIIGAGISGIASANKLKSNGFQVTVLEGRNRLGGRIFTDKSLGFPVDLGASWIHGINNNPITKLARQFQINIQPTNYENADVYHSNGKIISPQQLKSSYTLYKQVIKQLESLGEKLDYDISVAEGIKRILTKKNLNPAQKRLLFWYLEQEITLDLATDLENISLWELNQDEGFNGDDYLFPNGYEQIINKLAEGLDIKLDHKVTEIKYNEQKVEVKTTKGNFAGDAAIITLPLGVLKSNSIIFSPSLPKNKLSAINNLDMGILNKIVLQFPQIFWDKNKDILSYVSEKQPEISFFVNVNKYTSNPVIMAFAAGKFGQSLENNSDEDVTQRVMKILQIMYGNNIPNPSGLIRTKWHNDPFSFGSYSTMPVGTKAADRDILAQRVKNLFFAGEATSKNYPATVHGAFLSGIKAAEDLQKKLPN